MRPIERRIILIISSICFICIAGINNALPKEKGMTISVSADSLFTEVQRVRCSIQEEGYPAQGITVLLEPGSYSFNKTMFFDSLLNGTPEHPIVFKVEGNGKAVFNGGINMAIKHAELVTDTTTLARLNKIAGGKVYQLPIDDVRMRALLCDETARLSMFGRMMSLSRYPNVGFTHIEKIRDEGAIYAHGRTLGDPPTYTMENPVGGVFTVHDKDISKWETEFKHAQKASVTGYLSYDWYRQHHRIASISNGDIKLLEYSRYGVLSVEKIPRRFYVSNLLCELDSPGEFYYDDQSQNLFFWPFGEIDGNSEISIWAGQPFLKMNKSSNIRFENIVIEGVAKGKAAIEVTDCDNVQFAGCVVRNCNRPAVVIEGGKNCGLQSCDIYDVPHHLTLDGGNIRELIPSANYARNCHFTQVQATDFYGRIMIEGVGQVFQNNLVHNFIGQVMTVNGNDHLMEYNELFNIGIEEGDGGTIYSGAAMWSWGNLYRHNFLHHLMCIPEAHPRGGIYPDDRDQGDIVTENLFYKAAHRAILLNGGAGHTVTSNIFLKGYIGIYNTESGSEKMFGMQADYDSGKLKRGDKMDYIWRTEQVIGKVGWNKEPWKSHYPKFAKIMNQEKRRFYPIECTVTNNCFCQNRYNTQFVTKDENGKRLELPFEKVDYH